MTNYFQEERKRRLKGIVKWIEAEDIVYFDKLLAKLKYEYGLSTKTAHDYIKTLVDVGELVVENGAVSVCKKP